MPPGACRRHGRFAAFPLRRGSRPGGADRPGKRPGAMMLALLILLAAGPAAPAASREDSAHLIFQKTAGQRETRIHIVQKGEWIAGIFRSQRGDEPVPYALIRQLNPGIRDLNRVRVGQRIVLPLRATTDPAAPAAPLPERKAESTTTYRIQEGDSLSRILLEEFQVDPADVLKAYRLIRRLNPELGDLNHLQRGSNLKLPRELIRRTAQEARPAQPTPPKPLQTPPPESAPASIPQSRQEAPSPPAPVQASPGGTKPQPGELLETVVLTLEKPPGEAVLKTSSIEPLLSIIRPVIGRMKGTVTAAGNYFIPLKDASQITLDCSLLPVVELDDGSLILLDFANRLSEGIKGAIRQSWPQASVVAAGELPDQFLALQAIIGHSRNYTMTRTGRALTLSEKPEVQAFPDWIIAAKREVGGVLFRQGLFLLEGDEKPLSDPARRLLENGGLSVTEVADARVVMSPPASVTAGTAVSDLRGLKGLALAEALLKHLGETAVPNAEVVLFDQARDGFNLAVTADLLLRKGEKRILFLKKKLPEQFVRILKEGGTEVIVVAETDAGRPLLETVLRGIGAPVSLGYYSYRFPDAAGKPRLAVSFSALRTTAGGEPLFLVDFDPPAGFLALLKERNAGQFVRY